MYQYFHELHEHSGGNVKVELNISYYTTKATLKGATVINTPTVVSNTDLFGLKTKVDNLGVDKNQDCSC